MKLYATVTSERASKGQGGEYLDIDIQNESKEVIATIKVRSDRLDGQSLTIWHGNKTDVRTFKDAAMDKAEKGEKQKGERDYTKVCPVCWEKCGLICNPKPLK